MEETAAIANEIAQVYQNHYEHAESPAGNPAAVKVVIVDPATPGLRPVRPNKPVNLAIGALAGLLLGTAGGAGFAGYKSRKQVSDPGPNTTAASRTSRRWTV